MYNSVLCESVLIPVTEFEVQSDCYQYLKDKYPVVRGEIKLQIPRKPGEKRTYGKQKRQRGARFDLVVCDRENIPIFTIEVKRKEKYFHSKKEHYEYIAGIPNYLVGSLDQLKKLLSNTLSNRGQSKVE